MSGHTIRHNQHTYTCRQTNRTGCSGSSTSNDHRFGRTTKGFTIAELDPKTRDRQALQGKIKELTIKANSPVHQSLLTSDKQCNFFTGIKTKAVFTVLHNMTAPLVNRMWRGSVINTKVRRRFVGSPKKFGPDRKLTSMDEFLLVLMKLRLGLLNKDIASRFGISLGLVSQIFISWLTAMDKTIGSLVFWPTKEQVIASKPTRYRHLLNLVSIIDCSEIVIEKPKNLDLQFVTWSDYKHHNTTKFLIAVSPNSAITYVSPLYCGRISDKALTNDCGYLDLLEPYDEIMANKGFMIRQECEACRVHLRIPPGKRGTAQMTVTDVTNTKKVANIRILVEQVIRRVKTFRIMKYEMPISLVGAANKIVRVVSGLCNLQLPIYKQ